MWLYSNAATETSMNERWRSVKVDNITEIPETDITMANLKFQFRTCTSIVKGRYANREVTYRKGYATPLGNIEEACWVELVKRAVISELGEKAIEEAQQKILDQGTKVQKDDLEVAAMESFFIKE